MAIFRATMLQRCCAENRRCESSSQQRLIVLFLLHLLEVNVGCSIALIYVTSISGYIAIGYLLLKMIKRITQELLSYSCT